MARFNSIMIETGTAQVANSGTVTIPLDSPFKMAPAINVIAGPAGSDNDPGGPNVPSFNANVFVTSISKASGAWTFTVNTEGINETVTQSEAMKTSDGTYTNIQIIWRATGPVSAT